jgi:biopolymer transport protein ExbD
MLDRSKSAWNNYERHHGPNMTPMVDVVMVILIFFMASTTMLGPEWLLKSGVARADAGTKALTSVETRRFECVLFSASNGSTRARFTDREIDLVTLRDDVIAAADSVGASNVVVVLNPEATVSYDDIVLIHEWCAKAGITKIGLGRAP